MAACAFSLTAREASYRDPVCHRLRPIRSGRASICGRVGPLLSADLTSRRSGGGALDREGDVDAGTATRIAQQVPQVARVAADCLGGGLFSASLLDPKPETRTRRIVVGRGDPFLGADLSNSGTGRRTLDRERDIEARPALRLRREQVHDVTTVAADQPRRRSVPADLSYPASKPFARFFVHRPR